MILASGAPRWSRGSSCWVTRKWARWLTPQCCSWPSVVRLREKVKLWIRTFILPQKHYVFQTKYFSNFKQMPTVLSAKVRQVIRTLRRDQFECWNAWTGKKYCTLKKQSGSDSSETGFTFHMLKSDSDWISVSHILLKFGPHTKEWIQ